VRKLNGLVSEIAQASSEQSQGIGQVSTAVAQIDKVTQSNAAAAEESASAAEEMNAQTAELNTLVGNLLALVGGRGAEQKPGRPDAVPAETGVRQESGSAHAPRAMSTRKSAVSSAAPVPTPVPAGSATGATDDGFFR